MTLPKLLAIMTVLLFGAIGIAAIVKNQKKTASSVVILEEPIELQVDKDIETAVPALAQSSDRKKPVATFSESPLFDSSLPDADRVNEFFNKVEPKLPIVETVTYKSHVSWQAGRPAWLSDYANHYQTSRHFIARSLNGKADYLKQNVSEGDKFNVLRKDKNFEFYLLVDTSRNKMWFYYIDLDSKQKVLIKTYQVGLGRIDPTKKSGLLTPLGKYTLGDRIAIYKPKVTGLYQGKKIELITVFGTRWIPFDKEIGSPSDSSKGLGLHGTPWVHQADDKLVDDPSSLGKYESDGCIRLSTADMEELYAIIITKPTVIEIVHDFNDSTLAQIED